MSGDYISREAARNTLYEADAITMRGVAILNNFPAADVAPVRHGRWIPAQDYSNGNEDIECSSCGEWFKSLELCGRLGEPNYCPVCGAKMDGGGE